MEKIERRVIDISYKYGLSHIGSCLNMVRAIDKIYSIRKPNEPVILSAGHAGVALYVILEKYGFGDAEEMWKKHGTHPNRDVKHGIYVSSGSLGHGMGIAIGMAITDPKRLVYVVMSDGECAEGSVWEALRIARDHKMENLRVLVVANGYSGTDKVDVDDLDTRLNSFYPSLMSKVYLFALPDWIQGLDGHYSVMNKEMYEEIIKC